MKNIVFCADGTWNGSDRDDDGDGKPDVTNVARLFSLLVGATSPETLRLNDEQEKLLVRAVGTSQVAKYLHGVGDTRNPIMKVLGGVFGAGLIARIVRGYTFISRNYEPGDQIFLVGFSRGAYTARALAGLITTIGLLAPIPGDDRELAYRRGVGAWTRYRKVSGRPGATFLDFFDQAHGEKVRDEDLISPVSVRAVGVWDTVGSYGIPIYNPLNFSRLDLFEFASKTLSDKVEFGFHAVSVDEERNDFLPTLWENRNGVKQVLFSGAHADVGGGYPNPALSAYPLKWMIDSLTSVGAIFVSDVPQQINAFVDINRPWQEPPFKGLPHSPRIHPDSSYFHRSVQEMLDQREQYEPESLKRFLMGRKLPPDRLVD